MNLQKYEIFFDCQFSVAKYLISIIEICHMERSVVNY